MFNPRVVFESEDSGCPSIGVIWCPVAEKTTLVDVVDFGKSPNCGNICKLELGNAMSQNHHQPPETQRMALLSSPKY